GEIPSQSGAPCAGPRVAAGDRAGSSRGRGRGPPAPGRSAACAPPWSGAFGDGARGRASRAGAGPRRCRGRRGSSRDDLLTDLADRVAAGRPVAPVLPRLALPDRDRGLEGVDAEAGGVEGLRAV